MITACPSAVDITGAASRMATSPLFPAGKVQMTRIGFEGKPCASATEGIEARTRTRRARAVMGLLCRCPGFMTALGRLTAAAKLLRRLNVQLFDVVEVGVLVHRKAIAEVV